MAWTLSLRKDTFKFFSKQEPDTQNRIKAALNTLLDRLDEGIFPINEMDIRKLRGRKKDFFRLRLGKMRVVFKLIQETKEVRVFVIDYRGDVYKG